jgi:uracil phosphoribosyltransferase
MPVTVVEHPIVQEALARLRDKRTPPPAFRRELRRVGWALGYAALADAPQADATVETPLMTAPARHLAEPLPALVSVLRAGNGLLEGLQELLPEAPVGHLGIYRDHETLEAREYYLRLPPGLEGRIVLCCDPMLATAHTALAAVARLADAGATDIRYLSLVAAPEGIAAVTGRHPALRLWTAAIDLRLNEKGYILPGLGDAGDRLYGTG